ncbi:MAG: metal-dependent hydrolase [Anaerolineae bacterium]|nr:metal-dependent hydrolase [Anaerolineae bacterium]
MSSFRTHMLIGIVGGFGLYKFIELAAPNAVTLHITVAHTSYSIPPAVVGVGCVAVSAYLALWPDIDEPGSHISYRARQIMWIIGGTIGLLVALAIPQIGALVALLPLLGVAVGAMGGGLILSLLRRLSGGHRRLTHSLVIGTALVALGGIAYFVGFKLFTLPALALAWGQMLHLAGDVVTPRGVPLFYPFSRQDFRLLPYTAARYGEWIAAGGALLIGLVLLWLSL